MKPLPAAVCALSALLFGAVAARAAQAPSSCVTCHRASTGAPTLMHTFEEWEISAHAKAGVDCSVCHGGDPSRADKAAAHAGMPPSANPKSRVYYTRIPETCGACHAGELKAFKGSLHYKELSRNGRGPNCVTCHGAMADTVIKPRDMELTCTLCHRLPTRACDARQAVEDARLALKDLEAAGAKTGLSDLRARLRALLVDWHGFQAERVLDEAQALKRDADAARAGPRRP
jgi:hypothetical protein